MEIDGWTTADYDRWKRRLDIAVLCAAVFMMSSVVTFFLLGEPWDLLPLMIYLPGFAVIFVALFRLVFGFLIKRPVSEEELFLKTLTDLRVDRK